VDPDAALTRGAYLSLRLRAPSAPQLFVGVVIDNFNRIRDERRGYAYMTDAQKEWVETRKLVQAVRPLRQETAPRNPIRRIAYMTVTHR
jgi:hypothetical protein